MATISSPGVGSQLDVNSIVESLVNAEKVPFEVGLERDTEEVEAKLSALGILKGALSDFQSSVSSLRNSTAFNSKLVESNNSDYVTATASSIADSGVYTVEVEKLAQSHKLAGSAFSSPTDTVGTGTLTFRFGQYDSDLNTFTANPDKAIESVQITPADNSLQGIRDAINRAEISVQASIINDGSGYRLVMSSVDQGEDNSIELTVNDGDGNSLDTNGLSQMAFDPTAAVGNGKNIEEIVTAQDALLKVDGLTISSSSNTVYEAIHGVTLNLQGEAVGVETRLQVAVDEERVTEALTGFVEKYNGVVNAVDSIAFYDAETREAGIFLGDSTVRSVSSQLRSILTQSVTGLNGEVQSLRDVGITTKEGGLLEVNESQLKSVLADHLTEVQSLFTAHGVADDSLINYSSHTTATKAGDYDVFVEQLASQGSYTGAAIAGFPLTINAGNDEFALKINGVQSGAISITQQDYLNGDDLAAEIQAKINSDNTLKGQGIRVQVSFDTDHLEIVSERFGSSSTVEITSVESADLGLAVAIGVDGVDIKGKIGGVDATGSGQYLTGAGDAEGLKVRVLGGLANTDRGTISFARGYGDRMGTALDEILKSSGILSTKTESLNDKASDIKEEQAELDRKMTVLEERLYAQYTDLDVLLGSLQATSEYLVGQLESLPGLVRKES